MDRDGVAVKAGGVATLYNQIVTQSEKDLLVMESIAIPISFVVLVWIFGGLYAALLPLVVGVFSIVGAMSILRGLTYVTDVSVFALNLAVAMGLALAIDYSLLIISRYREEVNAGKPRDEALVLTMTTAGRTVLFSALTVALALVALILFPMYFLKSFGYAGVSVVFVGAIAALVIVPAVVALLGDRIDALDVRRLIRRVLGRPQPVAKDVTQSFWYRTTKGLWRGLFRSPSSSSAHWWCWACRSSTASSDSRMTACCPPRPRRIKSATRCAATSTTTAPPTCPSSPRA